MVNRFRQNALNTSIQNKNTGAGRVTASKKQNWKRLSGKAVEVNAPDRERQRRDPPGRKPAARVLVAQRPADDHKHGPSDDGQVLHVQVITDQDGGEDRDRVQEARIPWNRAPNQQPARLHDS